MSVVVQTPVLDGIVFLLPYEIDPRVDVEEYKQIQNRIEKLVESGDCEWASVKSSRYYVRFRVVLSGRCAPLVQLGAFDSRRSKGGVRIELNPSQLDTGDAVRLRTILRRILGVGKVRLRALFAAAKVNKLHVAVDCVGADLCRMLVAFKHIDKLSIIIKRVAAKGWVEGYNFGARTSAYHAAVYDKRTERVHRAVEGLLRAGRSANVALKHNKVKQFYDAKGAAERVRVEVRGQKLRGTPVNQIKHLTNRFAWFSFVDLDLAGSDLPPSLRQAFISIARDVGVKAALANFKHTRNARRVNLFWRSHRVSWWQPDLMWSQVESLLVRTQLFPPEAFIDADYRDDHRNRADDPPQATKKIPNKRCR